MAENPSKPAEPINFYPNQGIKRPPMVLVCWGRVALEVCTCPMSQAVFWYLRQAFTLWTHGESDSWVCLFGGDPSGCLCRETKRESTILGSQNRKRRTSVYDYFFGTPWLDIRGVPYSKTTVRTEAAGMQHPPKSSMYLCCSLA